MEKPKYKWEKVYTFVLIANLIYLILFYLITNHFTN
ncbi:hypothetical protein SAMN05444353_2576 [Polaribacter dokdonensis DSW-5]|nr:hypothetical protein SAMN05444353_2576 [Polaribacter dokdonensis DSW-5]